MKMRVLLPVCVAALAEVLMTVTAVPQGKEKSYHPAGTQFKQRMRTVHALVADGEAALQQGDYALAESKIRQALKLEMENDPATWLALARVLDAEGRTREAYQAYGEAFASPRSSFYSNVPRDVRALARYSLLCDEAGQWSDAVRAYGQARDRINPKPYPLYDVSFDPNTPEAQRLRAALHVVRGFTLDEEHKSGEAIAAFSEATRLQPDEPLAQFYLGDAPRKAGRLAEAKSAYERAARLGHGPAVVEAQKRLRWMKFDEQHPRH